MSSEDAKRLREDWQKWIDSDERDQDMRSIELRIAQTEDRLERLTDPDRRCDYALRTPGAQALLTLELAALGEDRDNATKFHLTEAEMENFLELMKNLAELHVSATEDEKWWMVENCFSNRSTAASWAL